MKRCDKCGQYVPKIERLADVKGMYQFSKIVKEPRELVKWHLWFQKKGIKSIIKPWIGTKGMGGYTLWREGVEHKEDYI